MLKTLKLNVISSLIKQDVGRSCYHFRWIRHWCHLRIVEFVPLASILSKSRVVTKSNLPIVINHPKQLVLSICLWFTKLRHIQIDWILYVLPDLK
jgi:hypothetical protein